MCFFVYLAYVCALRAHFCVFFSFSHHNSNASLHYLVKGKYQETIDNMKQMFGLTINFNLIY